MTNQKTFYAVFIVLFIGVALWFFLAGQVATAPQSANSENSMRVMSIESYVTTNISLLSPIKEQLGGTFYVTKIEASDGAGTVEYEDGHNAYTADFTYDTNEQTGITIKSFIIR